MSQGRLPSRFPIGTKFVIEAKPSGRSQVYRRHVEFPDGRILRLPDRTTSLFERRSSRDRRRRVRPT